MKLLVLEGKFAVCRLSHNDDVPTWASKGSFSSITRTPEELSIVCEAKNVPVEIKREDDFAMFRVDGVLDFQLTGVLASIAKPLASNKISIFSVSTFDTDYVLVRNFELEKAIAALKEAGFEIDRL